MVSATIREIGADRGISSALLPSMRVAWLAKLFATMTETLLFLSLTDGSGNGQSRAGVFPLDASNSRKCLYLQYNHEDNEQLK